MSTEKAKAKTSDTTVSSEDILFDCPACGKSLVVDISAEGMIVDCPQCRTNVIVPPHTSSTNSPPPSTEAKAASPKPVSKPREESHADADESPAQKRIAVLAGQLKEMQAQRVEITGRIASRLNEVNRDLVMLARLETSQQQAFSEWNKLVEKFSAAQSSEVDSPKKPVAVGS